VRARPGEYAVEAEGRVRGLLRLFDTRAAALGAIAAGAALVLVAAIALPAAAQARPPAPKPPKPTSDAAPTAPAESESAPAMSKPLVAMISLGALSLAPFILTMTTSFLKISVVGSILRSAMGTQQIPPNQVLTGLALILTIYIMAPTGQRIYDEIHELMDQAAAKGVMSDKSVEIIKEAIKRGKRPYVDFLMKHSHPRDRQLFVSMAKQLRHEEKSDVVIEETDFTVLVAAFVTSELTEAFQIGFIIFVPFIVIDMIVSNVLLAMGMQMLSPTVISLPCKLLLFVLCDGWHLIMKGLVLGYA
jgi:type III secretion protein R